MSVDGDEMDSILLFADAVADWHQFDDIFTLRPGHYPQYIPPNPKKRTPTKRCRVCYKKNVRRESRYCCPACPEMPGLCLKSCFLSFHKTTE